MGHNMRGRSFIGVSDFSNNELVETVELARTLKRNHKAGILDRPLVGKTLGVVFQKPSLRTRASFEVAMTHLGGDVVYLSPPEVGMGTREAVDDVAIVLSRYFDVISARVFEHRIVQDLAAHAAIPVINALSDGEHPCQALADLLTIQEWLGGLRGVRVTFVGDGNNVAASLALACAKVGADFTLACPEGYDLPAAMIDKIEAERRATGASFRVVRDPKEGARGTNVLYTDVWTSMGQEEEQERRLKAFDGFCIDQELVDLGDDAIVLHCLPAHYGEEITRDVTRGARSAIWDQAENRLHTAKAVLALLV